MTKYMILYNATEKPKETMAKTSPEEMKASMDEWINWRNEANKTINIAFGLPLQPVSRLDTTGASDSTTQVSGYATAEADSKDILLEALKSHPQLKRPGASIDVLEMLSMPGLDTSNN